MSFSDKLADARKSYPFETWAARFGRGLDQYTPENVGLAKAIMDNLIVSLLAVGDEASDEVKISLIKESVEALNDLHNQVNRELIETGEREELCCLLDVITEALGLDADVYGVSVGIGSEWRDW